MRFAARAPWKVVVRADVAPIPPGLALRCSDDLRELGGARYRGDHRDTWQSEKNIDLRTFEKRLAMVRRELAVNLFPELSELLRALHDRKRAAARLTQLPVWRAGVCRLRAWPSGMTQKSIFPDSMALSIT